MESVITLDDGTELIFTPYVESEHFALIFDLIAEHMRSQQAFLTAFDATATATSTQFSSTSTSISSSQGQAASKTLDVHHHCSNTCLNCIKNPLGHLPTAKALKEQELEQKQQMEKQQDTAKGSLQDLEKQQEAANGSLQDIKKLQDSAEDESSQDKYKAGNAAEISSAGLSHASSNCCSEASSDSCSETLSESCAENASGRCSETSPAPDLWSQTLSGGSSSKESSPLKPYEVTSDQEFVASLKARHCDLSETQVKRILKHIKMHSEHGKTLLCLIKEKDGADGVVHTDGANEKSAANVKSDCSIKDASDNVCSVKGTSIKGSSVKAASKDELKLAALLHFFLGELHSFDAARSLGYDSYCYISKVFVRPIFRGRGIARALLRATVLSITDTTDHAPLVFLDTIASLSAALSLYHKLGFTPLKQEYLPKDFAHKEHAIYLYLPLTQEL